MRMYQARAYWVDRVHVHTPGVQSTSLCLPYQGMQPLSRRVLHCLPVTCDLWPVPWWDGGAGAAHGCPVFSAPLRAVIEGMVLSGADADIMLADETLPGHSAKTPRVPRQPCHSSWA